MAEAYCTKIYNSGKNPDIFLHLIKTYLYPPEDSAISKDESIHLALRVLITTMGSTLLQISGS